MEYFKKNVFLDIEYFYEKKLTHELIISSIQTLLEKLVCTENFKYLHLNFK